MFINFLAFFQTWLFNMFLNLKFFLNNVVANYISHGAQIIIINLQFWCSWTFENNQHDLLCNHARWMLLNVWLQSKNLLKTILNIVVHFNDYTLDGNILWNLSNSACNYYNNNERNLAIALDLKITSFTNCFKRCHTCRNDNKHLENLFKHQIEMSTLKWIFQYL